MRLASVAVVLVALGCGDKDNSAETDQPSRNLTNAQSDLGDKRRDVTNGEEDVERRKRDLIAEQQALADKEKVLAGNRQQLSSAQDTLVEARAAYGAAVKSRAAKVDASLAALATRTDAAAKDAAAGLRARRDALATKLASMPSTADENWFGYVKEVDTTFDAIERDLQRAAN